MKDIRLKEALKHCCSGCDYGTCARFVRVIRENQCATVKVSRNASGDRTRCTGTK